MRARRFIFSSILVLLFFSTEGQEVIISEEFNLKNDFFYELIGNLDERVFLFRDKGFRHEMFIFNEYLELVDAVELGFEKRKIDVYGMCSFNNEFHLIYSYKHKGDQIIKMNRYDSRVRLVGEDTILQRPFPLLPSWARFTISEDKSQVLLFRFEFEDKLEMMSYNLKDRMLNWTRKHDFKDPGARRDFRKILISNEGKVYVLQEKNNSKVRRKDTYFKYLSLANRIARSILN